MNEKLKQFLKKRGLSKESIEHMIEDKVDETVIGLLRDDELEKYITKYGDRVAVSAFSKMITTECEEEEAATTSSTTKKSLIDRLKSKVNRGKTEHLSRSHSQKGNKNAKKKMRRVEFGWLDFESQSQEYKQVKAPSGGGTRHESFDIYTTLGYLRQMATEWFFPEGQSRRGKAKDYDFFITDATHKPLDEDLTIHDVYEMSKCKMLRLYLVSHKKVSTTDVKASQIGPVDRSNSGSGVWSPNSSINGSPSGSTDDLPSGLEDAAHGNHPESPESLPIPKKRKTNQPKRKNNPTLESTQGEQIFAQTDAPQNSDLLEIVQMPINEEAEKCIAAEDVSKQLDVSVHDDDMYLNLSSDNEIQFGKMDGSGLIHFDDTLLFVSSEVSISSASSESCPDPPAPGTVREQPDSSPRSPTPPPPYFSNLLNQTLENGANFIKLHRSRIQPELLAVFMDPNILHAPIKVQFVDEKGADAQGLSREAYSAFWKDFFLTASCGENERVPAIFPDYGQDEWEAIGRILLKGYQDTGVFPLQLSYAFSVALINGVSTVTPDILLQSLKKYLCHTDAQILDKALLGEQLDEEDKEDLLDLLSRVKCHSIPNDDEMRHIMISIAHKELIQEPKYALDCMASTARQGFQALLPNAAAIQEMYESKTPTARKVIKLLHANPVNQDQSASLSYLKEFIKGLDHAMLKKFLRYATSAEMICIQQIEVSFNQLRGLGRAPQVHTCGPLLELPSTYTSYPDLRSECMAILESNYLQMDIV